MLVIFNFIDSEKTLTLTMATPFFSVKKKGPIRQKSAWNQTSQI